MKNITPMTGMGAIFVRGFMEAFYEGKTKLFDCQAAGKLATLEAGEEISNGYLSTLSRRLVSDDVVAKYKVGRNWYLKPNTHADAFEEFLTEHEEWGLMLEGTVEDLQDKSTILNLVEEHGAVRGGGDNLIPRAAFKMLMAQVNEGKMDIVFVKAGLTLGVKHNGETHRIARYDD